MAAEAAAPPVPAEMDAPEVPVYGNLADVYGIQEVAEARQRYATLGGDFQARYQVPPALYARAPGRVNIIGEHIDYSGYGVLPMAIGRDVVVAIALAGTTLDVSNHADGVYPAFTFVPDPSQLVDTENHVWANYALAAYKGVHDHLDAHPERHTATSRGLPGIKLLVHGTVPSGGGLSSSSAFVVAVAVAILAAYECHVPQPDIAAFTCTCERHVGVNSGGMDQAISTMGRPGEAAYVQFNPVRAAHVALPAGAAFVVAHSLAVSNKAETAAGHYNLRVVECRLAAVLLAIKLGYPAAQARELRTLKEVEDIVRLYFVPNRPAEPEPATSGSRAPKKVSIPEDVKLLDRCADAAAAHLPPEGGVAVADAQDAIGCPLEELFADFPSAGRSLAHAAAPSGPGLKLQERAVHVFSEGARVLRFRNLCAGGDTDEVKTLAVGGLMRMSHESCRDKFDCSSPELEDLVACARRANALGSRLTGAGWGGCTVHLLREAEVEAFLANLRQGFYTRRLSGPDGTPPSDERLTQVCFASTPHHGAAVLTPACLDGPA